MRMGDERRNPRFASEPVERPGPGRLLRAKQLDRDLTIEAKITRTEYLGRAVASDRAEKLVMRDPSARRCHAGPRRCHWGASLVDDERRAYSALASASGPKSASARRQIVKSSSYSRRLVARSPLRAARAGEAEVRQGNDRGERVDAPMFEHALEFPGRLRARPLPPQRFRSQVHRHEAGDRAELRRRRRLERREGTVGIALVERIGRPRRRSKDGADQRRVRIPLLGAAHESLRLRPQPGERKGRCLAKPWHGGGRVRPGFDERDDTLDLLCRARRREEERFGPGQVRGKSRSRAAKPARKRHVGGAPIQLTRLLGPSLVSGHLRLCRYQVELPRPVLRPRELRRGPGGVARDDRELVEQPSCRRRLDPERDRFVGHLFRLGVVAHRPIGNRQVRKRERVAGASPQRLARLGFGLAEAADPVMDQRERVGRPRVAREGGLPGFKRRGGAVFVCR